jgi:hypothetical protein
MKMKRQAVLLLVLAPLYAAAQPSCPSPTLMAEWIQFTKPVTLSYESIDRGHFQRLGNAIHVCGYEAKGETLSGFVVGIYEHGTLFGTNRTEAENRIYTQIDKFKELSETHPDQERDWEKYVRIDVRPDGRKVFFTIMGFGPGGSAYGGFTTIGDYDILLQQLNDSEDDTPPEEKLKDPSKPTKDLPEIFKLLEKFIIDKTKER